MCSSWLATNDSLEQPLDKVSQIGWPHLASCQEIKHEAGCSKVQRRNDWEKDEDIVNKKYGPIWIQQDH